MRISLLWKRIVVSRITILYFSFSVLHCIIQNIFQIRAFAINDEADRFLKHIINQDRVIGPGFTFVDAKGDLRWCNHVPKGLDSGACRILWSPEFPLGQPPEYGDSLAALGGSNSSTTALIPVIVPSRPNGFADFPSATQTTAPATTTSSTSNAPVLAETVINLSKREINPLHETVEARAANQRRSAPAKSDRKYDVVIKKLSDNDAPRAFIRENCLKALNWPAEKFANTKREDVAFIGFQFWLFGMSLVAILNESIPHIIASFGTHVFATAWGVFQLAHTAHFKEDFTRVITNGACAPTDLLADYWVYRSASEIPSLVFNVVALFISMFLTWKLITLFGWQTYKHLGSNMKVKKMYVCVLYFSIILQLGLFFMVVGVALWLDQLYHGAVAELSKRSMIYKVVFIVIISLIVPWMILGWYAVRKESRTMMWIFLALTFIYVGGFVAMFSAPTFRWTIITWPFFGLMEAIGAFLAIVITVLSIMCRLNFGKGLAQALDAHEGLIDKNGFQDDVTPVTPVNPFDDPEKCGDLASTNDSLPEIKTQGLSTVSISLESPSDGDVYLPYKPQSTVTRSDTTRSKKRWVIE